MEYGEWRVTKGSLVNGDARVEQIGREGEGVYRLLSWDGSLAVTALEEPTQAHYERYRDAALVNTDAAAKLQERIDAIDRLGGGRQSAAAIEQERSR